MTKFIRAKLALERLRIIVLILNIVLIKSLPIEVERRRAYSGSHFEWIQSVAAEKTLWQELVLSVVTVAQSFL